jgi:glycine/D-amino acid oxidase-like deaminating enzyme
MSKGPHIAVVGAGIVGSAIALELASRGAVVTLVDAGGERASENSFGWINASWFNRPDCVRLRHFSMGVWRGWADRIPGLDPHWSGCLTWDLDDARLNAFVRDHGAMGYAIRMVDRDTICRIEPGLFTAAPTLHHAYLTRPPKRTHQIRRTRCPVSTAC